MKMKWLGASLTACLLCACGPSAPPPVDIFNIPVTFSVGKKPSALEAADMNADGYPDLLVANAGDDNVMYLQGKGDGSFESAIPLETGREPLALATQDFNGDNIPDVAVANYGDGDISIILGQKDSVFKRKERVKVGRLPIAIVAGDFNNDEKIDLAVTLRFDKLIILLGVGDGRFKPAEAYKANGTPASLVAGDFNSDKNLDLAVAFNAVKANYVRVYLGKGDGTFKPPKRFKGGHQSSFIASHDMDMDGYTDLIVSSFMLDSLTLFSGDGRGDFTKHPDFAGEKGPEYIVPGEFTDDKFPDLAICNRRDGSISILEGRGDGTFLFPHVNYPVGNQPRAMTSADFNRDGLTDLAVALYQAAGVSIFMRRAGAPLTE